GFERRSGLSHHLVGHVGRSSLLCFCPSSVKGPAHMTTPTVASPTTRQTQVVSGVLDIDAGGKGHLRGANLLSSPSDPAVSPALLRRHGLRRGDRVEGVRGERRGLVDITRVEGRTP